MRIDQNTRLFGLIGHPVGHSMSPIMHNAAFRALGQNAVYLAFDTTDLQGCLLAMRALGIQGMSITLPYKTVVIPLLDEVDEGARRIGAVNTLVYREGRLLGYNTDGTGALRALEERMDCAGKRVLIVGAGGAARAISFALKEKGVTLCITNRSVKKGEILARAINGTFRPLAELDKEGFEILIQTTPVGMFPFENPNPVPENLLRPGMTVMDIIYHPLNTTLLRTARSRGCQVIPGIAMFVNQGAEQFRLWTGLRPPMGIMTKAVLRVLGPFDTPGGSNRTGRGGQGKRDLP